MTSYTVRLGVPLLLLSAASCNLWPGGLGHVDMPYDEGATRQVEQRPLEEISVAAPTPVEEGLEAVRQRQPAPEGELPRAVQRVGDDIEPMSIAEMRLLVLQNNLDLQVALLDPELARVEVSAEEGVFDALIGGRFAYRRTDTPPLNGPLVEFTSPNPFLDGQQAKLTEVEQRRELLDMDLGVTVPLPTGGEIAVGGLFDQKSNIVDPTRFDQYLAATRFSFSQPLLRNAGPDANLAAIRMARVGQRRAQVTTKLAALRVLAMAEKAYWRLYAARRVLDVRAEQFRIASENLELSRRRVAEGLSPRVEIPRAEVGVYERLESLIAAEAGWQLAQRALKIHLATDRFPLRGAPMIDVTADPRLAGLRLDADALVARALAERLDLIELELQIIRDGLRVGFRENQVLPIANLDFQYGTLARDGSLGSAWTSQWDFDNPDLYVGLSFEVPLTNQRRRAQLQQAMLIRSQRLATKRARELTVQREVHDSIDVLERNWQRVLAARQNVLVAGVNYDAERRQFDQGLRTMREVLEALTELGQAQLREVAAIVDYQISQIDVAFASGTLLGYARVDLGPLQLPDPSLP